MSTELRARKLGSQLAALSAQGFDGFALFDGTPRPSIRRFSDDNGQATRGMTERNGRCPAIARTPAAGCAREHVGLTARLSGWVHRKRDHGNLVFIDLRDHYGITQCVLDSSSPHFKMAEGLRPESVITVTGRVTRPGARRGQSQAVHR